MLGVTQKPFHQIVSVLPTDSHNKWLPLPGPGSAGGLFLLKEFLPPHSYHMLTHRESADHLGSLSNILGFLVYSIKSFAMTAVYSCLQTYTVILGINLMKF